MAQILAISVKTGFTRNQTSLKPWIKGDTHYVHRPIGFEENGVAPVSSPSLALN